MITYPNTKINLGLNILRKRTDGYHDIETVFVPYFGFTDVLEIVGGDDFSRTSAGLFSKYSPGGMPLPVGDGAGASFGERKIAQGITQDGKCMITIARDEGVDWDPLADLCVKAYKVLDADFKLPAVKIYLEKRSPVGAGLGGGSADAAFTLKTLSELFGLGLDEEALAGYASGLGSDCAFFIFNRPMFGEGRGEVLSPVSLAAIDGYELKVVAPSGIRVSTAQAYANVEPHFPATTLREALRHPVREWKDLIVNDFESPVFALYPRLAAVKQSLYDSGAVYASMSGSGSALYALYSL